jgi:glucose-6-phosphate isomerase
LFPLALLGGDLRGFLAGAAAMDVATRRGPKENPAIWLAERWLEAQAEQPRAMVVLPYSDRLACLSRYLQQLVMESLGKRLDRSGGEVRAALTVYGHKGSTDQHAYIQQLRDGPDNFFAVFIEVVQPDATDPTGDLLYSLLDGTRAALYNDGKACLTVQLPRLNARALGALIALFERAVGLYAEVININAYNQPGVEAGKQAAAATLEAQGLLLDTLSDLPLTTEALCDLAGLDDLLTAWRLLCRLSHQGRGVERQRGDTPRNDQFFVRRTSEGDISSTGT